MATEIPVLGQLIQDDSARRDAIHIAVAPVIADEVLRPGQHVALVDGATDRIRAGFDAIGIVDPFLKGPVMPGQKCWLFLYPGTITSLRHLWTHPAFERKK